MSSNTPLMDSTEDNNQEQNISKTKVPSEDKQGSASTVTEKIEKLDSKKRSVPSLDKSGNASKTETERTEKQDSKKISVQLSSSDYNKLAEQDPKYIRIKIPKTTCDDKSFSIMSQSLDIGLIPRKKQKKKVSEASITHNEVTQDPDDTNKEAKVGSSIEGTKQTPVCVTPHP